MGYNKIYLLRKVDIRCLYRQGGFNCNGNLICLRDIGSKSCTYRPSLSLYNEISRNIVGLLESGSGLIKV